MTEPAGSAHECRQDQTGSRTRDAEEFLRTQEANGYERQSLHDESQDHWQREACADILAAARSRQAPAWIHNRPALPALSEQTPFEPPS